MKPSAICYIHHKKRNFRFDKFMERRGKVSIVCLLALAAFILVMYLRQNYFGF
jgi:hypothetical protein